MFVSLLVWDGFRSFCFEQTHSFTREQGKIPSKLKAIIDGF